MSLLDARKHQLPPACSQSVAQCTKHQLPRSQTESTRSETQLDHWRGYAEMLRHHRKCRQIHVHHKRSESTENTEKQQKLIFGVSPCCHDVEFQRCKINTLTRQINISSPKQASPIYSSPHFYREESKNVSKKRRKSTVSEHTKPHKNHRS